MGLTHHLSALIFLGVWIVISLVFLYLMCRREWVRRASLIAGFITTTTILAIIAWWIGRLEYEFSEFSGLTNSLFHSDYGIPLLLISVIILYLIPVLIPEKILALQTLAQRILIRKKIIYAVMIIGSVIGCILVINFVIGKSTFFLSYPIPMLFNGICIAVLALIGLYYFLEKDRLFVLAWVAVLSSALVLSMERPRVICGSPQADGISLYPACHRRSMRIQQSRTMYSFQGAPVRLTQALVLTSIVTTFPAVVFFGQPFEPGHPVRRTGAWSLITIPRKSLVLSGWMPIRPKGKSKAMCTLAILHKPSSWQFPLTVQTYFSFVREGRVILGGGYRFEQHYLVILPRMKEFWNLGKTG